MSLSPDIIQDYPEISRDWLLSVLTNHRIANNLSTIASVVRMSAVGGDGAQQPRSPEEVREFLDEIGARIDIAARLHRMLADGHGERDIALAPFLLGVAGSIMAANARAQGTLLDTRLTAGCTIPADKALAVALIVAELVANAVKYAHPTGVPGRIELSCEPQNGGVIVEVADDGVGLPQGFNPRGAMTAGFRTMRGLAHELGAELSFHQDGIGLRARLNISAISLAFAT